MFGLENILLKEKKYLEHVLGIIDINRFSQMKGSLHVSTDREWPRYYHYVDGKEQYITVNNRSLAISLAQKDCEDRVQKLVRRRYKQVCAILNDYKDDEIDQIYEKLHPGRKKLVTPVIPTWEMQQYQWLEQEYQTKPGYDEYLRFQTERGECVRSKSEKIMADYFYKEGIPYKYEKPLQLNSGRVMYPDFTFLSHKTGREVYWEHMGRMDDPEYVSSAIKKINTYMKNGIYEGENLILTFETSQDVLQMDIVKGLTEKYLKN